MRKTWLGLSGAMALSGAVALAGGGSKTTATDLPDDSTSISRDSMYGGSGVQGSGQEGTRSSTSGSDGSGTGGSGSVGTNEGVGGSGTTGTDATNPSTGSAAGGADTAGTGSAMGEQEVTGKIIRADRKSFYLEHMGVVVPVKVNPKTQFDGDLRGARDLKAGQEVRASIEVRNKTDNVATRISLSGVGGSGESFEGTLPAEPLNDLPSPLPEDRGTLENRPTY